MGLSALNPAFLATLAAVLSALVVATVAVRIIDRRSGRGSSELRDRVNTWWVIVVMFFGALIPGRAVTLTFFAFVSFLALKEYFSLVPTRRADRRVMFWAYLAILAQYAFVYVDWYAMVAIFIPVYMFLLLPLRMVMIGETAGFLTAAGTLHWGLMTTVYSLSYLGALLLMPFPGGGVWRSDPSGGATLIVYLAIMTQANDVFAYIWGKSLGRRKIVPKISPGKTWAGFAGSVLTTTGVSMLIAPHLTPLTLGEAAIAGLIIGVGGFFGDVSISAIKRDLHIKDSGSMLPGHGGVLDRVDSLTYTAPLFFHFLRYLHF